ncbi:MAG TPA: rhomboid family intramembrane serine protease [Candidatus Binatia bacterium]|nr:rhomboid family intramembrane serine protease [Candidatus Binatia bacterium]
MTGEPIADGPLSLDAARALLDRAAELLASGEFEGAALVYRRLIGHADVTVTAAALLGLGEALYRLDDEAAAVDVWQDILRLPETPATYHAWRQIAAARVRSGDLRGALEAYREAERRAPAADRAEIASRLGWLTKEIGDTRASRRYFARARGEALVPATLLVVAASVVVTVTAWASLGTRVDLYPVLELDKRAVVAGEWWRLWTVTLVHGLPPFGYLHLAFNMYALYLAGSLVEQLYGSRLFALLYLLGAASGSVASVLVGGDRPSVGASGAVFALFGVLLAVSRSHHPLVDRRARALLAQLGPIVAFNLVFGFLNAGAIDNAAHVGGLVGGLWLGFVLVPGRVPTLRTAWQRPPGSGPTAGTETLLRWLGVVAFAGLLVAGLALAAAMRLG